MSNSTNGDIETMNADDRIKEQTRLFGLIAEQANSNRVFVALNKRIKEANIDAMMIPMNIRPDDFYFTLSNMKKSHVNGAYIAAEYQEEAVELLDEKDEFVEVYGRCDFVLRDKERLIGTYLARGNEGDEESLANAIFTDYIKEDTNGQ